MTLFVDSGAWYAAVDSSDRHNARAKSILASGESLVTTSFVLVETWLLIRHRAHRQAADRFWGELRSGAARLETVTIGDLEAAWAIGAAFPDQDFSLVDRTSFAVMERLGLRRVFAFDDDFAVYRFGSGRRRAFEVVRRVSG